MNSGSVLIKLNIVPTGLCIPKIRSDHFSVNRELKRKPAIAPESPVFFFRKIYSEIAPGFWCHRCFACKKQQKKYNPTIHGIFTAIHSFLHH
jgi:hypothetical protein